MGLHQEDSEIINRAEQKNNSTPTTYNVAAAGSPTFEGRTTLLQKNGDN